MGWIPRRAGSSTTTTPSTALEVGGKVLVFPGGRGSSSSSNVLAESIRLGTAPAALALERPDGILLLGALVAAELYEDVRPVVVLDADLYVRHPLGRSCDDRSLGRGRGQVTSPR